MFGFDVKYGRNRVKKYPKIDLGDILLEAEEDGGKLL